MDIDGWIRDQLHDVVSNQCIQHEHNINCVGWDHLMDSASDLCLPSHPPAAERKPSLDGPGNACIGAVMRPSDPPLPSPQAGFYDKTMAEFFVAMARKASSSGALTTQLLSSGLDDSPKARAFAEQLYQRVSKGGG
jgi:hypothetical protein